MLLGGGKETLSGGPPGKIDCPEVFPGASPPVGQLRRPLVRLGCRDYDEGTNPRLVAVIGAPFILLVAGWGQGQYAVKGAASDAASQAATATADAVRGQICSTLQDGQLSAHQQSPIDLRKRRIRHERGVCAATSTPAGKLACTGIHGTGVALRHSRAAGRTHPASWYRCEFMTESSSGCRLRICLRVASALSRV